MRATHLLQLPQEMLTEIIMYLPPAEKSKVRATCSLFKDLVDQPVVWRKSTIVLRLLHLNQRFNLFVLYEKSCVS
uniref:F-box domain-containing protein n=1 Tax=Terrapene triunguis TaxID=2587831 RepID=A0A674IND1_9SAUR